MEKIQETASGIVTKWYDSTEYKTLAMLVLVLLCSHVWHIVSSYKREERLEAKTDALAARLDEYQKADRIQMVNATNNLETAVRDMAAKLDNLRYNGNPQPIVR